jgi:hypothetical protein
MADRSRLDRPQRHLRRHVARTDMWRAASGVIGARKLLSPPDLQSRQSAGRGDHTHE